jgi:L-ascorbate metabolism protein UlaG (beta-lactamase superfamily)
MQHEPLYYLREDVYFEPLVLKWYAWPYLIPPVSAAMNLAGRNLRLMKSFVANHQLHIAASENPGLAGGDFVNCTEDQLGEVRDLIDQIETEHVDFVELRKALAELNKLLEPMKGLSLESLYTQVPERLRGYVELVYDMNHSPGVRLIEGLLYNSDLYKTAIQSISLGLLGRVEQRPFVLSSPRLPDANHLHAPVAFADPRLDTLFRARDVPLSRQAVQDLFADLPVLGGLGIEEIFSEHAPVKQRRPLEGALRISYLGHAGLMLETSCTTILVDPVIASRDGRHDDDIISFSEIPDRIDYICLTHTHMDHVCLESLLQLRHKTDRILVPRNSGGLLVDPSLKLLLGQLGFCVTDMEDMELIACEDGSIRAIPFLGEHADLNIRSKAAWVFDFAGKIIFAGADSSSLDPRMYERVQKVIGNVDLLFIGMECVGAPMSWLYGSLFTKPVPRDINESRRFNGSDSASVEAMIAVFKPSGVFVYALGMEPWFKYFMGLDYTEDARQIHESAKLLAHCASLGISAERLFGSRVFQL